jgi:D-lactate dehydrogenase (cytochrome)
LLIDVQNIRAAVDERGWLDSPDAMAPYLRERRGLYHGRAAAVVRPADTAAVAHVVQVCAEAGIAIVAQGGNTGLSGGAAPHEHGGEILLSLERLNRIRGVDAADYTLTVEAGCLLADVQKAAADANRLFPLSLASEGSCRIGGNLATNAGGTNVLRYGNARDLALGLEAVLADGRVWHGLSGLRKDNSGYDLKDLLIGSEGTLGIITAATLKLFPKPVETATALLGLDSPETAVQVFARLREASGDTLTACELMSRFSLGLAVKHIEGCREPMAEGHPWYLLAELSSPQSGAALHDALEKILEEALASGAIRDAVVAQSQAQVHALWQLREAIPEAQTREGASIKHDVSVPITRIPELLERASDKVAARLPGVRPCPFGHMGDGNIHFNFSQPERADPDTFLDRWDEFNRIVFDIVGELGGSISAEHGVGQLKRNVLPRYKSPEAIAAMRRIKRALDPTNIMNPGKVIPDEHEQ